MTLDEKYTQLRPGDLILEGDEYLTCKGVWLPVKNKINTNVIFGRRETIYRRKIPAPIKFEIPHLCQMCGCAVTKDLVDNFWNSPLKEFRAFMGRCGSCFDQMRFKWEGKDA